MQVHGACVAVGRVGVLIRGAPGAGKSDLAMRLIDGGALLVADDRVDLTARDGVAWASPPPRLAGLLEARGLGLVRLPHVAETALGLVVDLRAEADIERLPEPEFETLLGVRTPRLELAPFAASAAAKVRLAARNRRLWLDAT